MNAIDVALYSTLTGGTALTNMLGGTASVYHIRAPDNADYPYVVFSVQGGGAENINPSDMRNYLYYVRCYTQTGADNAALIHEQIKALLDKQTLTVTGFTNIWTRYETEIEMSQELASGVPVYTDGGLYRIRLDT